MTTRKTHAADYKAKIALEATREDIVVVELAKRFRVRPFQINTWKRSAINNMASTMS